MSPGPAGSQPNSSWVRALEASRHRPRGGTPSSSPLDALRARGVDEPAASLTAETAVAVFRTAFDRWLSAEDDRDFPGT